MEVQVLSPAPAKSKYIEQIILHKRNVYAMNKSRREHDLLFEERLMPNTSLITQSLASKGVT